MGAGPHQLPVIHVIITIITTVIITVIIISMITVTISGSITVAIGKIIAIIITRPKPAYSQQGLDWIVGPGHSFVVFSTNKTMETNQKP